MQANLIATRKARAAREEKMPSEDAQLDQTKDTSVEYTTGDQGELTENRLPPSRMAASTDAEIYQKVQANLIATRRARAAREKKVSSEDVQLDQTKDTSVEQTRGGPSLPAKCGVKKEAVCYEQLPDGPVKSLIDIVREQLYHDTLDEEKCFEQLTSLFAPYDPDGDHIVTPLLSGPSRRSRSCWSSPNTTGMGRYHSLLPELCRARSCGYGELLIFH